MKVRRMPGHIYNEVIIKRGIKYPVPCLQPPNRMAFRGESFMFLVPHEQVPTKFPRVVSLNGAKSVLFRKARGKRGVYEIVLG